MLVLVSASLALQVSAQCEFNARTFHTYQEVYQCLEQVPFSESLRQTTLQNLRKTFSLYAFKDIVKNSPSTPVLSHIQTDLFKEFDRIAAASYSSDWDFQDDVAQVVLSLKDPQCVVSLVLAANLHPPFSDTIFSLFYFICGIFTLLQHRFVPPSLFLRFFVLERFPHDLILAPSLFRLLFLLSRHHLIGYFGIV